MARRRLFIGSGLRRVGRLSSGVSRVAQMGSRAARVTGNNPQFFDTAKQFADSVSSRTSDWANAVNDVLPSKKARRRKSASSSTVSNMVSSGTITQSFSYFGKKVKYNRKRDVYHKYYIEKDLSTSNVDMTTAYGTQGVYSPSFGLTGASLLAIRGRLGTPWSDAPLLVLYYSQRLTMNNNDVANAFVTIYECAAKVATANNAVDAFAAGLLTINAAWTPSDIDASPMDSAQFTEDWRLIRKTVVPLQPGCTHQHTMRYAGFKEYDPTNLSSGNLPGLTIQVFIVVKGTPIRDTANVVSTSTPIITYTLSRWLGARSGNAALPVYYEGGSFGAITDATVQVREVDGDVVTGSGVAGLEN